MARITYNRPTGDFDLKQAIQTVATGKITQAIGPSVDYQQGAYTASAIQLGDRILRVDYAKDGKSYASIQNFSPDTSFANPDSVFAGDDSFTGSDGNDHFYASTGNDYYDGKNGIDTVHYAGSKNDYTVQGTKLTTQNKTDFLNNIERLHFEADGSTRALDIGAGQNAGSAYRLYQAAFDRKADTGGLSYWVKELDNGATLQQVAQGFVDSAEFKVLTPGTDAGSIINSFYQHVLHREADEGGFKYWADSMAAGMTASEVLVSFSESAENINNTSADLNGGLWLV